MNGSVPKTLHLLVQHRHRGRTARHVERCDKVTNKRARNDTPGGLEQSADRIIHQIEFAKRRRAKADQAEADPGQRLADRASALGAIFHEAEARSIVVAGGRAASIHFSDGSELQLDGAAVVVAAGAHSKGLAADVGCDIALDTERGYHVEIANPDITLTRPVLVSDGAFFASTMQGRLRLAGTVEIGGLSREPDWRRADAMVERAKIAFPGLRATEWTRWMGFRPSMPNSLPVIGASPLVPNAYVACGHGHLGMTLGAVTGTLIADAILGRAPMLDPSGFAPRKLRSFNPRVLKEATAAPASCT